MASDGPSLVIYDSSGNERYQTEVGEFLDVAAVGDEIWVMSTTALTRLQLRNGRQIAVEAIDYVDPAGRFLVSSTAPLLPVWHGERPVAIRLGPDPATPSSTATAHTSVPGPGGDILLPIADGRWLLWQSGQLRLWRSIGEAWRQPLGDPGSRPFDAKIVLEGRMFVLAQWRPPRPGEDGSELRLSIAALSDGSPYATLRLPAVSQLAIAARRGLAAVRTGNRVGVFDLRFGRSVYSLQLPDGVIEFAVDDGLEHIALRSAAWLQIMRTEALIASVADVAHPATPEPAGDAVGTNGHSPKPKTLEEAREVATSLHRPPPGIEGFELPTSEHASAAPLPSLERATEEPLPDSALIRLNPVSFGVTATEQETAHLIKLHVDVVAARVGLAIAASWDSGRISQSDAARLPFLDEVNGLMRVRSGRAADQLASARKRHEDAEANLRTEQQAHTDRRTPIEVLAHDFQLSPVATSIVLAIAAPRLSDELARLYAILANDSRRPLVDEFLLRHILGEEHTSAISRELDGDRPLRKFGMISLSQGERPFVELFVHPLVVRLIANQPLDGEPDPLLTVRSVDRDLEELQMPRSLLIKALRFLSTPVSPLANGPDLEFSAGNEGPAADHVRIVVRGRVGSGRHTLICSLAARAGRNVGVIDLSTVPHEPVRLAATLEAVLRRALLRGLLPCVDGLESVGSDEHAAKRQIVAILQAYPGPLALRLPPDATIPLSPGYLLVDLPVRNEMERSQSWANALYRHQIDLPDASELAARYRVGPGVIERVATEIASKPDRPSEAAAWVRELDDAVRQHLENRLGATAQRVSRLAKWSDVVLPEDVIDSLLELTSRVRNRKKVFEQWGFDSSITTARGITALFTGGPGTGKTMVAGVIARDLGLELYRVDVSRITSKWIGETEKNLGSLFDAAEEGQVMLLFDEADSLFAKRTEVKTSVDRYANMEVNYLLQRFDTFEGIAILTTNFGSAIDPAFKRRLTYRVTFPFPDEEMREQLWRSLIPRQLPIAGTIDFASLSKRFQLSGGYIRNAALRGAFLAAEEGSALTHRHLERAIQMEFREIGKLAESGTLE